MKRGVDVAETLTGLEEGYAVIIYNGVEVAESVMVLVVDGKGVVKNKGVEVALAVDVSVVVDVIVIVGVEVALAVDVSVAVDVIVIVGVDVDVGGSAEGLTEAASLPTVISTPHTSGRERVAE